MSGWAYSRTASTVSAANGSSDLDQRHEPRAGDREEPGPGVERVNELRVATGRHRRLRREQADAPVAGRLHGRVRLGRDHADDRDLEPLLELRERSRGRGVAGGDDELHALRLEVAGDLARVAPDLVERPRAVREPCEVAEVDEILVRLGLLDTLFDQIHPAERLWPSKLGIG